MRTLIKNTVATATAAMVAVSLAACGGGGVESKLAGNWVSSKGTIFSLNSNGTGITSYVHSESGKTATCPFTWEVSDNVLRTTTDKEECATYTDWDYSQESEDLSSFNGETLIINDTVLTKK